MKKFLFVLFSLVLVGGMSSYALDPIILGVGYDDPIPTMPGHGKSPVLTPSVWLDDYQIVFQEGHADYTLEILDEDGLVVYSANVPTAVTTVVLPTWLSGDYEIRLLTGGTYYFYGDITL